MPAIFLALIDEPTDKEKFIEIYNTYRNKILRKARSILHNDSLAEEAVQECLFRIAKSITKISSPVCAETASFILIIIRNICCDIIKKEHIGDTVYYDEAKENYVQDKFIPDIDTIVSEVGFNQVISAISAIEDIYGDVLKLKYLYGYSGREIAEILDISQKAANMRMYRGKKLLKEKLEENGYVFK